MSETTKRTLGADMIDLSVPWDKRIDRTHLAARPVDQQALRASRLGAEGGVKRETTNSVSGIGPGCTERKWALYWMEFRTLSLCLLVVASVAACLILSHGSDLSVIYGPAFVAFCASIAVLWKMARGRASGGGAER
ncbi:hypothetical protein C0V97_04060 [Asaia sp. W19]|uniref:hypothetical protein n=1 Tax=unclassified Asaia TaxID=2685023 RepID=UPI000F8E6823|nr:hypothetical protein [Asaia sp. W19]RUT26862.1 hypothetical protein C0V97_04060 [Asaia sp. W19]